MRCGLCKLCIVAIYSFRLLRVSFILRSLFHFFVVFLPSHFAQSLVHCYLSRFSEPYTFITSSLHSFALMSLHSIRRHRKLNIFVPITIFKHDTNLHCQRDIPHRSNCCDSSSATNPSTIRCSLDFLRRPRCVAQVFLPKSRSSLTTSTVLVVAIWNCCRSAAQLWFNDRRLAVRRDAQEHNHNSSDSNKRLHDHRCHRQ